MAEALLINKTDIAKYTSLDGNIDYDKLLPFVKIAQDIWIQQYTGTDLLNKIKADILANTLAGNYLTITTTFLKPMLIFYSMVEYLPFSSFQISNNGVYQKEIESSTAVSYENIQLLAEKYKKIAENYSQRFVDYMCFSSNLFPEYTSNTNDDIHPIRENYYTNWHI